MQQTGSTSAFRRETTFEIEGQLFKAVLFTTCHDPLYTAIGCPSILQSRAYHSALESAPPEKMTFWYVRLESGGKLAGILSFQVKDFNPGDSLKNQVNGSPVRRIRYKMASLINPSVLCLGNTLVTGDYGFCFQPEVPIHMRTLMMMETIDWMLELKEFKKNFKYTNYNFCGVVTSFPNNCDSIIFM